MVAREGKRAKCGVKTNSFAVNIRKKVLKIMKPRLRTILLRTNPLKPEIEKIREAADVIRRGGLVAFPTETVYGLGADALNAAAVAKIFAVKRRPAIDPIIVHVAERDALGTLTINCPQQAWHLAEIFWPGPLTLVASKAPIIPDIVTAGLDTVALRMPANEIALSLVRESETPIAAPSANLFSRPSATTAQHVLADFGDKIDLILDGGQTKIGIESTVLDLTSDVPTILRPGGVSLDALRLVLREVRIAQREVYNLCKKSDGLKSPGLFPKHYSPLARLLLFVGEEESALKLMRKKAHELKLHGEKVGILVAQEQMYAFDRDAVSLQNLGSKFDLNQIANNLFAAMRALDEEDVDTILAMGCRKNGIGLAISDRLIKAAGGKIIDTKGETDE